jgi:hypothetical protein
LLSRLNWAGLRLRQRIALGVSVLIFAGAMIQEWIWFAVEILARLALWPRDWLEQEVYGFVAATSPFSELFFYFYLPMVPIGLTLLLRRHRAALHVLGVGVLFYVLDWVVLASNPYYDGAVEGTITLGLQIIAYVVVIVLWADRYFLQPGQAEAER